MQKLIKQSKALLLLLAFVLVFSPLSALADSGEKQTITYVSLGDSLAEGMLSDGSVNADYDGFAGYIKSNLDSKGYAVNLENYGKSGYTSKQVLDGLHEVKELADADIITISAGANDVLAGLDAAYLDYLIPGKVEELYKIAEAAREAAGIASDNALNTIDDTIMPVNAARVAVFDEQETVSLVMVAIEPFMGFLPLEVKVALVAIYEDIETTVDNIKEADTKLFNAKAMIVTNPVAAASELEALANNLSAAEQKTNAIAKNLGIIEEKIGESLLPVPPELIAAVQDVIAKANQAAGDVATAKDSVQNAKDAVNVAIEAQSVAKSAAENAEFAADKAAKLAKVIAAIPTKIEAVGINMKQILGTIKEVNPSAKIYVMGYYNAMPYLSVETQKMTISLLNSLNEAIEGASNYIGATYVPTFHLFEGKYGTYLPNPKNIHPSDDGYRVLASGFMGEIGKSFPNIPDPNTPGEKKINLGEKVQVSSGEQLLINGTDVSLLLPEDLPEGTTLTVTPTNDKALSKAKGLKAVGDVLNFTFEFPEGFEDYEGTFKLVMGFDKDSPDDVAIYYFNEDKDAWESQQGKVNKESHEISLEVSHFSNYGVFVQVDEDDPKDPPATENPSDEDDTPPVTKDPTKGSDKGGKNDGKKTTTNVGEKLPKTATNNYALLLLGMILLASGSASLIFMRKKRLITNEY